MSIFLVRHVRAGNRDKWRGNDALRPASKAGRRQAEALAKVLPGFAHGESIARVVTSPYARCRQTVEPLAVRLGVPLEDDDALAEGAPLAGALRLVEKYCGDGAVLCTHGDVLGELLRHYASTGLTLPHQKLEKASTWALVGGCNPFREIRYLPPPQ